MHVNVIHDMLTICMSLFTCMYMHVRACTCTCVNYMHACKNVIHDVLTICMSLLTCMYMHVNVLILCLQVVIEGAVCQPWVVVISGDIVPAHMPRENRI